MVVLIPGYRSTNPRTCQPALVHGCHLAGQTHDVSTRTLNEGETNTKKDPAPLLPNRVPHLHMLAKLREFDKQELQGRRAPGFAEESAEMTSQASHGKDQEPDFGGCTSQ